MFSLLKRRKIRTILLTQKTLLSEIPKRKRPLKREIPSSQGIERRETVDMKIIIRVRSKYRSKEEVRQSLILKCCRKNLDVKSLMVKIERISSLRLNFEKEVGHYI